MGNLIVLPFAALLRWMYAFTQSYGLSIILFAVVVKLVTLPFQMKSKRSMVRMGRLSSKQQELQKQYANNQQKYQEEITKLYTEAGVNPMGGCLWSFLPLFFIFPLYRIIYNPITHFMGLSAEKLATVKEMAVSMGFSAGDKAKQAYEQIFLTDFISQNWEKFEGTVDGLINVNFSFLGLDLSTTPTAEFSAFAFTWSCIGVILIPIIATVGQFISAKIMAKSNGQSAEQQAQMRTMNLMMPLMTLWFCFMMPAAMGVYWIINTILSTVQEMLLGKFYTKRIEAEEAERAEKLEASRKLRQEEARKRALEQKDMEIKRVKKQPQKTNGPSTTEAGRVGDRPYARGRSYKADRYDN